ncbi:MAG: 5-formyltetrahydrofolate cyclo-ligase [Bdellovibrionales bacterium]
MGDLYHDKNSLRSAMEKLRCEASAKSGSAAARKICRILCGSIDIRPNTVVASYHPQRCEISPEPLIAALRERGCEIALPVVIGKHQPLTFRAFSPGNALAPGFGGIPEPLPQAETLSPDLFLVPLLAFDRQGNRLGYGGGYYDRTLNLARLCKRVLAIGLAYSCQEIENVPHGSHDMRLDAVLTEKELLRMPSSRDG